MFLADIARRLHLRELIFSCFGTYLLAWRLQSDTGIPDMYVRTSLSAVEPFLATNHVRRVLITERQCGIIDSPIIWSIDITINGINNDQLSNPKTTRQREGRDKNLWESVENIPSYYITLSWPKVIHVKHTLISAVCIKQITKWDSNYDRGFAKRLVIDAISTGRSQSNFQVTECARNLSNTHRHRNDRYSYRRDVFFRFASVLRKVRRKEDTF